MEKGKAFFVVGHQDWGKSATLKALTEGNWRYHWWRIDSHWFFIRRMSNDDRPLEFYELLGQLEPVEKCLVIIALCPTFQDKNKCRQLIAALKAFKRKYEIYFFVLPHAYGNEKERIKGLERNELKRFGKLKLSKAGAKENQRAKDLEKFIVSNT